MPSDPLHAISKETKIGRALLHILGVANNAGSGSAVSPGVAATVAELIEYPVTTADVTAGFANIPITGYVPKIATGAARNNRGDYLELGSTVIVVGNSIRVENRGIADFLIGFTILLNVTGTVT